MLSSNNKIRLYELQKDSAKWFKDIPIESIESIILYHGTSSFYLERILKEGLKPRKNTGVNTWKAAGPDMVSNSEKIYLGTRRMAEMRGESAINLHSYYNKSKISNILDGKCYVVLFELEVDANKLVPDEDSHKSTWHESLITLHSCAYEGVIPSERIRKTWKSVDPFIDYKLIKDFQN